MPKLTIPYNYTPRPYQIPFLSAMDSGIRRACWVCHRRSGKTKTLLNYTAKKMIERVGTYYHCFPEYAQGRKVLWDGIDGAGVPFLDAFPPQIVKSKNSQEMKLSLTNGSVYQIVGADNYDSVVGSNPVGFIFDEWALSDKYPTAWDYFRPILVENGGWAVFPYTPRGMNHGYTLYEMAKNDPSWFCQLLTVDDTGVISPDDINAERQAGMSDDMIAQEFYCSFVVVGSRPFQFSRLHHVIDPVPVPRNAPVYMAMDWGFGAPFSVVWCWTDNDGRVYQFNEWYGWNGQPNKGLRLTDSEIARGIIERESLMGIARREVYRLAGPDCFQKKPDYRGGGQGPSTAETFADHGLYLSPGDPSRELKLRQMRERLMVPDDGTMPMFVVYRTCEQTIRTLPLLATDPKKIEDVATDGEDHIYDSICHVLMSRPIGPSPIRVPKLPSDARIDLLEEGMHNTYDDQEWEHIRQDRERMYDDRRLFGDWEDNYDGLYVNTVE